MNSPSDTESAEDGYPDTACYDMDDYGECWACRMGSQGECPFKYYDEDPLYPTHHQ